MGHVPLLQAGENTLADAEETRGERLQRIFDDRAAANQRDEGTPVRVIDLASLDANDAAFWDG